VSFPLRLLHFTHVGHVRASGKTDACGTRTGSAEGVSRYPLESHREMTMAATTKKQTAKPDSCVDAKQRINPKAKGTNIATKKQSGRSAVDSDTRCKKVGLADALREEGIDERAIAQGFASLHRKLSGSEDKGDLKLFFDVLKDNHRTLEPPTSSDRGGAGDGPVTIILRHNMARPARETNRVSDSDRCN
jgi:hypothetical protein